MWKDYRWHTCPVKLRINEFKAFSQYMVHVQKLIIIPVYCRNYLYDASVKNIKFSVAQNILMLGNKLVWHLLHSRMCAFFSQSGCLNEAQTWKTMIQLHKDLPLENVWGPEVRAALPSTLLESRTCQKLDGNTLDWNIFW